MTQIQSRLPSAVRADVKAIADEIYNLRDFNRGTRDTFEITILDELRKLDAEPASWRKAIRGSLQEALKQHCAYPAKNDAIASKIRLRNWETEGASEWDGWAQAPGRLLQSFLNASNAQVKRATQVLKQFKALEKIFDEDAEQKTPTEEKQKDSTADGVKPTPSKSEGSRPQGGANLVAQFWAREKQVADGDNVTIDKPTAALLGSANGIQKITNGKLDMKAPVAAAVGRAAGASLTTHNTSRNLAPEALLLASATGLNVAAMNKNLTAAPAAGANVSVNGVAINALNASANATAVGASASASARALEVDIGNASANAGVGVSAKASARLAAVKIGNAQVDLSVGPNITKTAEGLGLAIGNIDIAPLKFGGGVSFGGLKLFNFSLGGVMSFDLNPLNILNLGFGGGAGSAGGGHDGSSGGAVPGGGASSANAQADISNGFHGLAGDSDHHLGFSGEGSPHGAGHNQEGGAMTDGRASFGHAAGDGQGSGVRHETHGAGEFDYDARMGKPSSPPTSAPPTNLRNAARPISQGEHLTRSVADGSLSLRVLATSNRQQHDALLLGGSDGLRIYDVSAVMKAEFPVYRIVDIKYLPGILKMLTRTDAASAADKLKVLKILFSPAQAGSYKSSDLKVEVTAGVLDPNDSLVKRITEKDRKLEPRGDRAESTTGPEFDDNAQELVEMVNEVWRKAGKGQMFDASFIRYVDEAVQSGGADEQAAIDEADAVSPDKNVKLCDFCEAKKTPRCLPCVSRASGAGSGSKLKPLGGNKWGFN